MGLPLLREAFDSIEAAAVIPPRAPANDASEFRSRLLRDTENLEKADIEFRITSNRQMNAVEIAVRQYISAGADVAEIIADLESFRDEVHDGIIELQDVIQNLQIEAKHLGKNIAEQDTSDGRFFRKQFRKAVIHLQNFLATRQKNIDRLTVLLAEIDPEARGGPTFEGAEDLVSYLRQQRG